MTDQPRMPLCPMHQRIEDRMGVVELVYGNNCVACSLNERVELLDILAGKEPFDGRLDSVTALQRALFVPGQYICPVCDFRLSKVLLRASDGAVGTEAEHGLELCPNDDTRMKPLTWQQCADEGEKSAMRFFKEREMLIYWLLRAYHSGRREGWEAGPSTDETLRGVNRVLCGLHYEPNDENPRSNAAELLKQEPVYFIDVEAEATQ